MGWDNRFSPMENQILAIIGRRKMKIAEISELYYTDGQPRLDRNNVLAAAIRRINRKCTLYNLNWTLVGKGTGRGGKTVWRQNNGR